MRINHGLLLISLSLLLGCSEHALLGETSDGGADARGVDITNPDPCGNGIDDDHNGRIDDGCPCGPGETQACFEGATGERGVGVCTDGVQTCVGRGSVEWGDWGESSCEGGAVSPGEEACDAADNDCDGAVDEGCPCVAGEEQGCGVEFLIEPCMGGRQTCQTDGTWSGCVGAIGPETEQCGPDGTGNGIDEDCNGVVDDPCGCVPVPEQCRDGIDNDCDNVVDEPECMPDWPPTCDPALRAPRPVAPLSTSRVTSTRPTLRWELPAGATEAVVELCADASCVSVLETLRGATSARPSTPLSAGVSYWRARAVAGGDPSCDTSPPWEFFVGARGAGHDTVQGFDSDFNRDGHPDFLMVGRWADGGSTERVYEAVHGRAGAFPDGSANQVLPGPPFSIGDVDGDGYGDAMVIGESSQCAIHRGTSTGLAVSPSASFANCRHISGLGDFDGDGYGDFVILSAGGGGSTRPPRLVFGSATLTSPVEVPHSTGIPNGWGYAHQAGDLNGDGLGDVVVSRIRKIYSPIHINVFTPLVFYGNPSRRWGSGTSLGDFQPVGLAVPDQYAAGDVNGDGFGDLVIALPADQTRIFHGGAAGIATTPSAVLPRPLGNNTARLGDVDGDGFEDFLVLGSVYRGGATGLATTVFWTPPPAYFWMVGVGDLDGDGREDGVMEINDPAVDVLALPGMASGFGAGVTVPFASTPPGTRGVTRTLSGIANE